MSAIAPNSGTRADIVLGRLSATTGLDAPQQIYNKAWPVLQGPATIAKLANTALLSSEAVEQPVPAGAAEIALAAAAIGPARGMR